MKLEQSFDVAAPLERVWQALIDVEHVAPCLPGAAVTGRNDDGSYNGTFSVKIGPTTASYAGKLEMQDVDESAHNATMHAHGSDKRGQGGATATILSKLSSADDDHTHVEVVTDYHITGRLARFGRGGMIEDISNKLLRQFADRLQQSLVEQPSAAAAGAERTQLAGAAAGAQAGGAAGAQAGGAAGGEGAEEGAEAQATAAAGAAAAAQAGAAPPGGKSAGGADEARVGETEDGGEDWAPGGREGPLADAEPPPSDGAPPPAPGAGAPSPPPAPGAGAPSPPPAPGAGAPPPPPAPETSEPIEGLSLMGSVVWGQIRRNPLPIAAFVLGLLIAAAFLRRARR